MNDFEKLYIQCARSLSAALCRYARDRKDEDKKYIASAHTELTHIYYQEELERKQKAQKP